MKKVDKSTIEQERLKVIQALSALKMEASRDELLSSFYDTLLQSAFNGGQDLTCEEYVQSYCDMHKVTVGPTGIFVSNDLIRNHKAFFYKIHETWRQYAKTHGLKTGNVSRETIALEFEHILEKQWDTKRKDLRKFYKPIDNPALFDERLREYTQAICGKVYPEEDSIDFRRAMAFISHFLWQTQMKLHHGPQSVLRQGNEAMLMLVSKQQKTGKSTTVRKLVDTMSELGFVWKTHFERLEDQFSLSNLAYNYIAWFDDAGRSSVKNMARFKQIVTDDEVNFRAMYTQQEMRLPKLCTLIGTSNRPARELLNDTTGLRRIHQIMVNGGSVDDGEGIDLEFLDDFDHNEFIRLVPLDPKATPLFRYITAAELSAYEQEIRPRSIIEVWMSEMSYGPGSKDTGGDVMPSADLYQSFVEWAQSNGYGAKYTPHAESFGHKLVEIGCDRGRTGSFRGFYIQKLENEEF